MAAIIMSYRAAVCSPLSGRPVQARQLGRMQRNLTRCHSWIAAPKSLYSPSAAAAPPPPPLPPQQQLQRCYRQRQRRRCSCIARGISERRQRDPASYSSMDELREDLEGGRGQGGWVSGAINWLSDAANSAKASSPLQAAYQWLVRSAPIPGSAESSSCLLDYDDSDLDPVAVQQLQALLLGSRATIVRLIRRCPRMLEMERADLIGRLVGLKDLFPGSDVARMVELAPGQFLEGPWLPKQEHLAASSGLLRQELEGAEVDFMFQEDPLILFESIESLAMGLRRMRELWPGLTPTALADSEPLHLSLAVKALGLNGPPKGF